MMKRLITAICLTLAAAGMARAADQMHGMNMKMTGVRVTDAWARATPGAARAGGAFLTITNHGGKARRVVGALSDVARRTELHTHLMDGGVMRMRKVDRLDLPPDRSVMLKPGGYHVMLMGLHAPLKEGDSFAITLVLADGEKIPVSVAVKKIGAMGPGGPGGHGSGARHPL